MNPVHKRNQENGQTFIEWRVSDVMIHKLAPLHEQKGELGIGPVFVRNQGCAQGSWGGKGAGYDTI